MKEDDSFKEFVIDQLAGFGAAARPMFGGYGLYKGDAFFGIIIKERLYFKTDATTRLPYEEQGMKPFKASATQTLKNYMEVPPDILEDAEELKSWARTAAALKKPVNKKR